MPAICVYCGSSDQVQPHFLVAARGMGAANARRGHQVVFGAGSTGLMGALADSALAAGGEVIGVIPAMFNNPTLCHNGLTRLEVVTDMHTRKARMIALADSIIALPGGFGTLEELFEAITWAQIGLHRKPIGLLNTAAYYTPLLGFIDHMLNNGFLYNEHRQLYHTGEDPDTLLDLLAGHQVPEGLKRRGARITNRQQSSRLSGKLTLSPGLDGGFLFSLIGGEGHLPLDWRDI